jgi:pyridoxal phosphate enzyme (YggS family)
MNRERLAENIDRVRDRIAAAARRAGRDAESVTLMAVTKTHPVETICEALGLGLTDLGENRVEEALPKMAAMRAGSSTLHPPLAAPTWHMIGHVQSRKARDVAEHFAVVHSVDSARLAERLSRFAGERGNALPVYLECNVSGEASKGGLEAGRFETDTEQAAALEAEIEPLLALPNLSVRGLMTMAPIVEAPEQARPVFHRLRRLRDHLARRFPQTDWTGLSMGMTDDFEVAIEEGATCVRIGRAIFGERP